MRILVTGVAGFIGSYVAGALLDRGDEVAGLDNMNGYYDPSLKEARLAPLLKRNGFSFVKANIADKSAMESLFESASFDRVVHLAAQAGVRYSLEKPHAYVESNVTGFLNILEGCRRAGTGHLVFASSSSVYGANADIPFAAQRGADHPVSLYGATKKANEMMAHSYAYLYGLPCTGLRFFTVYGPWGRPDMSPFLFTSKILSGQPIEVFNYGNHSRDFTFIDDIVDGVLRVVDAIPAGNADWDAEHPDPSRSSAPYRLFNIGNHTPVPLMDFIACIESATGKKAQIDFKPRQPGDVIATYADIDDLTQATGFQPKTTIDRGIPLFVEWYRGYYCV